MKVETAVVVAKGVTAGAGTVMMFGMTWWALAAALIGATVSLHFEPEPPTVKVPRMVFGVLAVAVVAVFLAVAAPHYSWTAWSASIPVEIRAGLLAVVVRIGYPLGRRWAARRVDKGGD